MSLQAKQSSIRIRLPLYQPQIINILYDKKLRQSMSRRGNCWDNAPQESFFGHMKDELAGEIPGWTSFADAKASIDRWMDYYNQDQLPVGPGEVVPKPNFTSTSPQVSTPPACCHNGSNDFAP